MDSPPEGEFDEAAIYEAAQGEEAATFYTPQVLENSQILVDAFKEKYPALKEVNILRLGTVELGVRYEQERDSGVVAGDVMMSTDPNFMLAMTEKGYFQELSPELVPNVANWPEEYVTDTFLRSVAVYPLGVLYNTQTLGDEAFADWTDLLDPRLEGELTLVDPRAIGTYRVLANMLSEEYGEDFLRELGGQVGTVVTSSVPGTQSVAAGESSALWVGNVALRDSMSREGAPIEIFLPDLTTGSEQAVAISTETTKPNTATLFLNFLLSQEGQEAFVQTGFSVQYQDIPRTVPAPGNYRSPWDQALQLTEERANEIYELLNLQ